MFTLIATLLIVTATGAEPSGVYFDRKEKFATEEACKAFVKTPAFTKSKDELVKFVGAHIPKGEKWGLAYSCEKVDPKDLPKAKAKDNEI